jgi:Type II secretion system (T2SS), protein G
MRATLIICGIVVGLIVGLFIYGGIITSQKRETIRPYVTYKCLMYIAGGCDQYKAQYGTWPTSLAKLTNALPQFGDPWDKDGWGREVILIPYNKSVGCGEVISYGHDGVPGGTGNDRDLEIRFPTDANANWNKQQGVGLKDFNSI